MRWLAFFQDFKRARTTNWGSVCLAYLYSSLDTLNWGTQHQLVGHYKLLEVSFSLFSFVVHAFSFLYSYIHMPYRLGLCTIFFLTTFIPLPCKLFPYKLPYMCLANCTIFESCKLPSCKLYLVYLANYHCKLCLIFSSVRP